MGWAQGWEAAAVQKLGQLGHITAVAAWAATSAGFFLKLASPCRPSVPLGQPKAQLIAVSPVPCALQQLVPRSVVRKGQAEAVVKLLARLIKDYKDVNAIFANSCVCLACLAIQEGQSFEELSRQVGTCRV